MDSDHLREQIRENAQEIVRLHSRIHETVKNRGESPEERREWELACKEFHDRYSLLAFPRGYTGETLHRISSGDPFSMEAAICFLEVRPYFFRSGYMFKDILRRCRRAPLPPYLAARLKVIEERLAAWRERKAKKRRRSQ